MNEHDHPSDAEQTPPLRPLPTAKRVHEAGKPLITFAALPAGCGWNGVLSALLRQPGQIVYQLHESAGGIEGCGGAGRDRVALPGWRTASWSAPFPAAPSFGRPLSKSPAARC